MRSALRVLLLFIFTAGGAAAQDIDGAMRQARSGQGSAAVRELTVIAQQGGGAAPYALGLLYANGEGVPADPAQAARWFEEAARRGHVEARRHLHFMREVGLIAASTTVPRAMDGAHRVQVATVPTDADAPREWRRLQRRHPDTLGALEVLAVASAMPDGGTLYRVQGGPLDGEAARAVCARLREEGTGCLVVRP